MSAGNPDQKVYVYAVFSSQTEKISDEMENRHRSVSATVRTSLAAHICIYGSHLLLSPENPTVSWPL